MTEFDVLNTTGGGTITETAGWVGFLIIAFIFLAAFSAIVTIVEEDPLGIFFVVIFAVIAITLGASDVGKSEVPEPLRYEVIVREGYVIDAARWEIVEQRGQIYVIQEREQPKEDVN